MIEPLRLDFHASPSLTSFLRLHVEGDMPRITVGVESGTERRSETTLMTVDECLKFRDWLNRWLLFRSPEDKAFLAVLADRFEERVQDETDRGLLVELRRRLGS